MALITKSLRLKQFGVETSVQRIRRTATSHYIIQMRTYENMLDMLFNSPHAQPQEILDRLGRDAKEYIEYIEELYKWIKTINPLAKITPIESFADIEKYEDGNVLVELKI